MNFETSTLLRCVDLASPTNSSDKTELRTQKSREMEWSGCSRQVLGSDMLDMVLGSLSLCSRLLKKFEVEMGNFFFTCKKGLPKSICNHFIEKLFLVKLVSHSPFTGRGSSRMEANILTRLQDYQGIMFCLHDYRITHCHC